MLGWVDEWSPVKMNGLLKLDYHFEHLSYTGHIYDRMYSCLVSVMSHGWFGRWAYGTG